MAVAEPEPGPISQPATPGSSMQDIRWMANAEQRAIVRLGDIPEATKCASANNPELIKNGVIVTPTLPPYDWKKKPGASGDNPALIPNAAIPDERSVYDPVVYPCIASSPYLAIPTPGINLDLTKAESGGYLTTTRAGVAYAGYKDGRYVQFAANTPRITDKGLLIEEARTNSNRNSALQGAVVGAPGTWPTNWKVMQTISSTYEIVGIGVEGGIDYVDVRITVPNNSAYGSVIIHFDGDTGAVPAVAGQAWTGSVFMRLIAGSLAGFYGGGDFAATIEIYQYDAAHVYQGTISVGSFNLPDGSPLGTQRIGDAAIVNYVPASGGFVSFCLKLYTSLVGPRPPIDVTFRIGWPQLELSRFVSSPIRTTGAPATRAMDQVRLSSMPVMAGPLSVYLDVTPLDTYSTTSTYYVITVDGGSNANSCSLRQSSLIGGMDYFQVSAGVVVADVGSFQMSQNKDYKAAFAVALNDIAYNVNGNPIMMTDNVAPVPTGLNRVGFNFIAPVSQYVRQLTVWRNNRLSNLQLQSITAMGVPVPVAQTDLDMTDGFNAFVLPTVRATSAYADNPDGTWYSFGVNQARMTGKGLLVEGARTNSLRNSALAGAVVGTPGTLPTNWVTDPKTTALSCDVVGTGVESGLDYVDIRLHGSAPKGNTFTIFLDGNTGVIPVTRNTTWAMSFFIRLVAGSLDGFLGTNGSSALHIGLAAYDASHVFLGIDYNLFPLPLPGEGNLGSIRRTYVRNTPDIANLAFADMTIGFLPRSFPAPPPMDATFRIAMPQLELGAYVTSPIKTTGAALMRAEDAVIVTPQLALFGESFTVYAEATPIGPDNGSRTEGIFIADDGTSSNRMLMYRFGGMPRIDETVNGVSANIRPAPAWGQGTLMKLVSAATGNEFVACVNGGMVSIVKPTTGVPRRLNRMNIGNAGVGSPFNGYIKRITIWPSTRLSDQELQAMTA